MPKTPATATANPSNLGFIPPEVIGAAESIVKNQVPGSQLHTSASALLSILFDGYAKALCERVD